MLSDLVDPLMKIYIRDFIIANAKSADQMNRLLAKKRG